MEAVTTIREMLKLEQGIIYVPPYQRAYSWDTNAEDSRVSQTRTFVDDLDQYCSGSGATPYYFGHFLFEKRESGYAVIDGQQRLTTIVIFLSALFRRMEALRPLSEDEAVSREDMIMIKNGDRRYRFKTVTYDQHVLAKYVVDGAKEIVPLCDTVSAERIIKAYDYFSKILSDKDERYLTKILSAISDATCTTHEVSSESEAIQMFLFQNNRGKKPSLLEIVKARLMFSVHIGAKNNNEISAIIDEIQDCFGHIYHSISKIEHRIDEDDVLLYTLRVYFNSLWIERMDVLSKIEAEISKDNSCGFALEFSSDLMDSFKRLVVFFTSDESKSNYDIASLITLPNIGFAIPFIIKAYRCCNRKDVDKKCLLAKSLESIILRQKLIGTRADLRSRLNETYEAFGGSDVQPVIDKIEKLKHIDSGEWWWAYWNDAALSNSLKGWINPGVAKYLLWKYEHHLHLIQNEQHGGYKSPRYDDIESSELEHIAPKTENDVAVESGYCEYDKEFFDQYLECIGNYLLISKSHNCSIGNAPFRDKRSSYTHLEQQREIREMTSGEEVWTKELIKRRKDKIIDFIMETF